MHACPVCGDNALLEDPTTMWDTHEICRCCGVQFGLEVECQADVAGYRTNWLDSGAEWFDDESRPPNWTPETAQHQIDRRTDR